MGNCFRRCLEDDSDTDYFAAGGGHYPGYSHGQSTQAGGGGPAYPRPGGSFTYNVVGFTAVARDLLEFETTSKVPGALSHYVSASKETQIIWYEKLLAAWKRANPPPTTAEAVAVLLIQTLHTSRRHNIQGLLDFYHLQWPKFTVPASPPVPQPVPPAVTQPEAGGATWPEGVKFEIRTLPVKEEKVGDGDGFEVFVDVHKDARETKELPKEILDAVNRRRSARAQKNYQVADALQKQIEAGNIYKVFDGKGGGDQCLARKYRIRLKGVDAPEIGQPYGEEAKVKLCDLVKDRRLLIHVYGKDRYGRTLGDVYDRNGTFIQEILLKEGWAWHFEHFDKREAFAKWERNAKAARLGLWADDNPEAPWDYKRKHRRSGKGSRKRGA